MRRFALAVAALAAVSCAAPQKAGPTPAGAAAAARARTLPSGFEPQPGETVTAHDVTRSGKPDEWRYVVRDASGKEVLVRKEKDLNGDGKVDTWEKYGPDGTVVRVAYDLDFDGSPDEILHFDHGQLVEKELAFGFDGLPRTRSFYEHGRLVRKERDTNGDGKVDTWEYWENGELDRIGLDLDGDGKVDRWEARRGAGAAAGGAAVPRDQK
jgi:hypothetical protein